MVDEHDVDVVLGGIYSSTRQAIKGPVVERAPEALHLPRAVRGAGVRPADLLHRPGAGAADRAALPVADGADRREDLLPAVGRLHLAARAEREGPGGRHRPRRHASSARSTTRSTTSTTTRRSSASWPAARTSCSTRSCPPGLTPFLASCTTPGSRSEEGSVVCTYFDENFLNLVPAEHVEGLYGCLDYYRDVDDPFSVGAPGGVRPPIPGQRPVHGRQRVHGHVPRPQAVGGGGQRGRLARHRRRGEGARHCQHRRRARAVRPRWSPASTTCG